MRLLITGGNGYVGRNLTRTLYRDHDVTVVDNLRSGASRFTPEESSLFQFVEADIRDFTSLRSVIAETKPEAVIHLAAVHYIPECEANPEEAIAINTLGTMNVARALNPGTRLIFISTAAVYAPEDQPHDETKSPIGPSDVYGYTKLHAEGYVRHFASSLKLDARIVRLFNVVGPGETNPHVLPAIFSQIRRGGHTIRLGNCTPRRDYVHVQDVAEGLAAVTLRPQNGSNIDTVNLGTGTSYSVEDLVAKLSEIAGVRFEIETDKSRLRPVDRPFLSAAVTKIARDYGWTARFQIEDSLRQLWQDPDVPEELFARC